MAYTLKQKLGLTDEDEQMPQTSAAAPSMAMAPGVAPQQKLAPAGASNSGAGWVNLQRYLGVAGDQGKQMARGLAGDVQKRGDAVNAGIGQAQTTFGQGVEADVKADNGIQFGSLAATPQFGQLAGDADKVGQDAKRLTDFSGRRDMLQQKFGSNAGESRMDSFLAGAAGGDVLKGAADAYGGLSEKLGMANEASAGVAKAGMDALDTNRKMAKDAALAQAGKAKSDADFLSAVAAITQGQAVNPEFLKKRVERDFGPGSWERYQRLNQARLTGATMY